ncbi:MAG: DUF1549 domain-containing protein, partial [Isosphaeraceae bacterium]
MRRRILVLASVLGVAAWIVGAPRPALASEPPTFDASALEFFESKVRPILVNRCQTCHGPEKRKGGLRLDSRATILEGGDSGPAAVEGRPEESLLIEAIGYAEAIQMPPKSRLPEAEIATLNRWVAMGLPWSGPTGTDPSKATVSQDAFDLDERKAAHWAWRPIGDPPPPEVADPDWPAGTIDRFILAKLDAAGLSPASPADPRVLIRRLTFDLTGLPPTPEEITAFLDDRGPDAVERLVDRLLASPRFGERWGRHWLDLVRFAETRGHEFDPLIPNAWRYRDYVARALNADVPYDQFVTEHIAGDLVPSPRIDPATGANESILGTGFWFLGEEVHSPVDVRQDETDRMDNRLDVMAKTFLGLTVACARCHDHKFDPIPQSDYYALTGFLISGTYRQVRFTTMEAERSAVERLHALKDREGPRVLGELARALRPGIERAAGRLLAAASQVSQPSPGSSKVEPDDPWVQALRQAIAEPQDPLHRLARRARDRDADGSLAVEERPDPSAGLVVDFGDERDLARWQNGTTFGLRPARPGEVRFADGARGVRIGVHDLGAAVREAGAPRLTPLESDDRDHGKLGQGDWPGQTLRTPEFTLSSGRLWYLVRGSGRAYASVNSHLVVAG